MNLSGATRVVLIIPGSLRLHDISREGRVLLARDDFTIDLVALPPGKQTERSLDWVWMVPLRRHRKGRPIGSVHRSRRHRQRLGGEYIRKMDGSPAVRIGDGAFGDSFRRTGWRLSDASRGLW